VHVESSKKTFITSAGEPNARNQGPKPFSPAPQHFAFTSRGESSLRDVREEQAENDIEEINRLDWSATTAIAPFTPWSSTDYWTSTETKSIFASEPTSEVWVAQETEQPGVQFLYSPRQSPEQLAIATFFRVFMPGPPGSKGLLDFLPLVFNGAPSRGVLASAIIAIGLNALAGKAHDNQLVLYSRIKYSHTLNELNQALQDTYRAKSDEVLTTVLLMAQLESISNPSLDSMFAHLEGAKALVKLRGLEALRSLVGMRTFTSLRAQIALACIMRNEKIPDIIVELSHKSKDFPSNDSNWASPLTMIVMSFCNIRARVHAGEVTDVSEILASFYAVDQEMSTWAMERPEEMQYTRKPATPSASDFAEYYDMYRDYWSFGIWNHYRTIHILCLEALLKFLTKQSSNMDDLEQIARIDVEKTKKREYIKELAGDICASMPFYGQIVSSRQEATTSKTQYDLPTPTYAGEGLIVMWPLGVIAGCPWAPIAMRRFAIRQLQILAGSSGNKQAAVLAAKLEQCLVQWELAR